MPHHFFSAAQRKRADERQRTARRAEERRGGGGETQACLAVRNPAANSVFSPRCPPATPLGHAPTATPTQVSVEVGVEVVLLAELVCERDAGEQLAPLALDGVDVEEHHQSRKEPHEDQQEDDDLAALAVQVHAAEADVRQEGEGQEEAGDEAADVGEVVDPGQQAKGKEEEHHAEQLGEGPPGLGQDLPALEQLHEQAGQDPELRAGRSHLRRRRRGHSVRRGFTAKLGGGGR